MEFFLFSAFSPDETSRRSRYCRISSPSFPRTNI